ncbi:MAG TPA: hypothetical protein VK524_05700 [Polyangiaceae bacterium]|nr:hypothetical protein [Polyangiaceae bacterium]
MTTNSLIRGGIIFLIALLGLAALVPVVYLLWRAALSDGLLPSGQWSVAAWAMAAAFVIISAGLLLATASLLLRLKPDAHGMTRPPSLGPSLVIVALGVLLGATSVLAAKPLQPTDPPARAR